MMLSSQIGSALRNKMPGKGRPYALSMIKGTPAFRAMEAKRYTSSLVNTFPEGFVGRETQIAATSSSTMIRSKST